MCIRDRLSPAVFDRIPGDTAFGEMAGSGGEIADPVGDQSDCRGGFRRTAGASGPVGCRTGCQSLCFRSMGTGRAGTDRRKPVAGFFISQQYL